MTAYNGSLISSLTSPTLSKPLETFEDIFKKSSHLEILTQKNTAAQQFMASGVDPIKLFFSSFFFFGVKLGQFTIN